MFRGDRIGTPNIFIDNTNIVTSDYTPEEVDPTGNSAYTGNAINATPVLDFGQTSIYVARAETYAAARRSGFVHQFTITAPIAGNTVGLELIGGFVTAIPGDATITPFFGKRNGTAALLAAVSFGNGSAIQLSQGSQGQAGATAVTTRTLHFRTQVIVQDTTRAFGPYGMGFFINTGVTAWSFTWMHMHAAIRQFNDLQDAQYRDVLR